MTKYKVVLVPFPFDDLSTNKVRPAVCLTDPITEYKHIILAFITSRVPDTPLATDLVIDKNDRNFTLTGLHVSSTIQLHRLMTVTTGLIRRELGHLPSEMQTMVEQRLYELFSLPVPEPESINSSKNQADTLSQSTKRPQ